MTDLNNNVISTEKYNFERKLDNDKPKADTDTSSPGDNQEKKANFTFSLLNDSKGKSFAYKLHGDFDLDGKPDTIYTDKDGKAFKFSLGENLDIKADNEVLQSWQASIAESKDIAASLRKDDANNIEAQQIDNLLNEKNATNFGAIDEKAPSWDDFPKDQEINLVDGSKISHFGAGKFGICKDGQCFPPKDFKDLSASEQQAIKDFAQENDIKLPSEEKIDSENYRPKQSDTKKLEEEKKQDPKDIAGFKPKTYKDFYEKYKAYKAQGHDKVKLQFSTSWCPHCRAPEQQNKAAHDRGEPVIYIDGDNPQFKSLMQKYNVRSYPTIINVK